MVDSNKNTLDLLEEYYSLYMTSSNEYIPENFIEHIISECNESNNFILDEPLIITWDITNKCNLFCEFCSASAKSISNKRELTLEENLKIVDKILDSNVVQVVIQGGEPFLTEGLLEIIERLTNNNIYVEIITNGTLITDNMAQKLSELRNEFIRIKVSIDGSNPKINDKIRGNGNFKKAIDSIKLLKSLGIYVRIQSVATKENINDMENIYLLACKENVDSFGFTPVLPIGRGINSSEPKIEHVLQQALKIKKMELKNKNSVPTHLIRLGYIQNIPNIERLTGLLEKVFPKGEKSFQQHCTCGKSKLEIDCDGQVYTCAFLRYDEFSAGNLLTTSIKQVWKNEKWDKFRTVTRNSKQKCNKCDLLWCCTGCSALAYNKFKNFNICDPNCLYKK